MAVGLGVKEARPATGTVTSVTASGTNQTALAANGLRLGASFYNNGSTNAYLKHGATATTSSYTVLIPPKGLYELPHPAYTGQVDVIWEGSPSGAMAVTESA